MITLPSTRSLQVFEAVARLGSVSRAGEELHITQPAVTQQLRRLESTLGVRLVERRGTGIGLTVEGRVLAGRLGHAFDEIRAAVGALRERQAARRVVSVAVLGTFAERWLIPRLAGFQRRYPDVEVRLLATSRVVDLEREDVDVAIRPGGGTWPGRHASFLMENRLFPVASPGLLARVPVRSPGDLARHAWIEVDAEPRRADWEEWLVENGCAGLEGRGRIGFANSSHALEAAIAGLGIAMGHTPFVADALDAGRLVAPLPAVDASEGDYWLVSEETRAGLARISAFREWVLSTG